MKKQLQTFLKNGILLIGISILFYACDKEEQLYEQQTDFKTVSVEDALNFLYPNIGNISFRNSNDRFITSTSDYISQELITNSNELLTVIPATTIHENMYSRILFLEIDNEIQSVVFSMLTDESSTLDSFTGKILITDTEGNFLKGYKVEDGISVIEYFENNQETDTSNVTLARNASSGCENECTYSVCSYCDLDEVVISSGSGVSQINYVVLWSVFDFRGGSGGNSWGSGGSGGGSSSNFVFNEEEMIFDEGDKPLEEYDNKCAGITRAWQLSQSNGDEYAAVLTSDGAILITQQLNPNGGGISGIYNHNGNTYYQYPASQGSPSRTYAGQLYSSGRYFIPIVASIHSHTPCINDGSDGITNNIINDDQAFANNYPNINHYIIGCNAIGQFSGSSNQPFNINNGNLSNICNNVN